MEMKMRSNHPKKKFCFFMSAPSSHNLPMLLLYKSINFARIYINNNFEHMWKIINFVFKKYQKAINFASK